MPFPMYVRVAPAKKKPQQSRLMRAAAALAALGLCGAMAACSVVGATVAVGSAAVSTVATVGSAAVSVGSTVVETTYDVTKAGVKAVAGSGDDAVPAH
ncbi:hypothetical protein [Cupriavidus basilensis]|nr:hypothetical protein [Cupriavidus basilensis]